MAGSVALCVDEMTLRNPESIGLEGEQLEAQSWLDVYLSGDEVRQGVSEDDRYQEAWVISCQDVEPINAAATIKADRPDLRVCLVSPESCGSLLSRAHTALIDEVMDPVSFLRRYADMKRALLNAPDHAQLASQVPMATAETTVLEPPTLQEREQPLAPTSSFLHFQPQPGLVPVRTSGRAFVLTVVSGSGGAGKSTVSALGALIARNKGKRTLLLDYDLQFGDVAEMVGARNPLCIDTALAHPEQLQMELAREERFMVLAAPARLETAEEVVQGLPSFLEQMARVFDVIVVNTGAAWAEQHAALLERSSAALFLVDQRASSVRACNHALELCARCGIASNPFRFALNRCAKNAPLTSIDVSCALQGAPVYELKDGGRDVEDYMSDGGAKELLETRNELAKSLEHVMSNLLPNGQGPINQPSPQEDRRPMRRKGRHAERKRNGRR